MIERDFELIESYLDGTLTKGDRREFIHKFKTNREFTYEVQMREEIDEAIRDTDLLEYRKQVKKLLNKPMWWIKLRDKFSR